MAREDKELLLKDLCARLPYGVIALTEKVMPHRSAWGYWADAQVIVDDKIIDTVRNLKELPKGTIEKLIGKTLTWADEPYKM